MSIKFEYDSPVEWAKDVIHRFGSAASIHTSAFTKESYDLIAKINTKSDKDYHVGYFKHRFDGDNTLLSEGYLVDRRVKLRTDSDGTFDDENC